MNSGTVCRSCLRAAARYSTSYKPSVSRAVQARPSHASIASTFSQTKRSYATPRQQQSDAEQDEDSTSSAEAQKRAVRMRTEEANFTEHNVAESATETLFKECARQADYIVPEAFEGSAEIPKNEKGEDVGKGTGWWYDTLGLTPTFGTWAQVTFLHMYLITTRLRYFPDSYAKVWMQHLTNHFFWEAEHRMTIFHLQSSKMMRQRYLKELYDQWRGAIGAYDEGLIKGDAVLAGAVWRNIFQGREDVDWTQVAIIVSYMRRALRALDATADKRIIDAMVRFGSPETEVALVETPSKDVDQPFTEEDEDFEREFQKTEQKLRN